MQPIFLKRQPECNSAFKAFRNAKPYTHQSWHFHEELEIAYIEHGCGTRFIGDSIQPYQEGDLVMLGSNLPHQWKSNYPGDLKADYNSKSLAIYFLKDFPGLNFYELPEMRKIKTLIKLAARGIKVRDPEIKLSIYDKLKTLLSTDGAEKVLLLFSILDLIAEANDNELLASEVFVESFSRSRDKRINEIYRYINDHFKREITLPELSAVINMTPNSFCRYFKKATQKTPIEYLNEIRINYACRLLIEGDNTISHCAYESGFNNLANFNRRFKLVVGMTPKAYIQRSENKE